MSVETKANQVLKQAKELARRTPTWADFSLELFDQHSGIVTQTFESDIERQAFFDSPQYKKINQLLAGLMKQTGVVNGATPAHPEKSGRFNVRIPKSLHRSLEVEAKREGVSLNQLTISKLSIPLRHSASVETPLLVQAFANVHDGYSTDRIVVDPDYNAKFLRRCHELGLAQSDFSLNHALYNIRKSKKSREKAGIELPATTKKTEYRDFDDYQFASEIAVRVLQRTEGVTLDHIMCDPVLAAKFDQLALQLVNQTVLKLRWAALNLRKTHRLRPLSDTADNYTLVSAGPIKTIDLGTIADQPGLYALYDHNRPIFAGETDSIRHRLEIHIRYGLPCVDVVSDDCLVLKTLETPGMKQQQRLRSLMAFVNRERPLLNYQKVA